jgi:hypothetical protein
MPVSFLPFDAVKNAIASDDAQKADYLVPLSDLELEVGEKGAWLCLCPFGTFSVSPIAQGQICQKLGLPLSYLRRCPPWLQRQNLSFWLSRRQRKGGKVLLRTKGEVLRAFLSPSFSPFDHRDLLAVLESLPSVGENLLPFQFALTETSLHLSLLAPEPFEVGMGRSKGEVALRCLPSQQRGRFRQSRPLRLLAPACLREPFRERDCLRQSPPLAGQEGR